MTLRPRFPPGATKSLAAFTRYVASLTCNCKKILRFINGLPEFKVIELCLPCIARETLGKLGYTKRPRRKQPTQKQQAWREELARRLRTPSDAV